MDAAGRSLFREKLYPFFATASKGPVPATGSAEAKL